jgi:hypothetical protein
LGTAMSVVLGSLFSGSAEMSRYSRPRRIGESPPDF